MDTNFFLQSVRGKLPKKPEHLLLLQDKLEKMSKEEQDNFYSKKFPFIQLKNPTLILVINFFLGQLGIARFMIGDYGLGAARLIFTLVASFMPIEAELYVMIIIVTWTIVDLYLVDKKVREQNLNKILCVL